MTRSYTRGEELLDRVLGAEPPAFALVHRPTVDEDRVEILTGEVSEVSRLADLPVPAPDGGAGARHDLLVLLPYRQLAERGFSCHDDGTPLLAMSVTGQGTCRVTEVLERLPDVPVALSDPRFDVSDDEYASIVRRVVADEIGGGVGANFVIKRSFVAGIDGFSARSALSLFSRLLTGERGTYWTFVVYTGDRILVGATPERHVSLTAGTVTMNPISGTFRYPPTGPDLAELMAFLGDGKEAAELYMVLDEELKMMGRITEHGGRVVGPWLKEMASLAHTEYLIEGQTTRDAREILRETMFAPTVTGSPVESACRVIRHYEPRGRGYYSGAIALIGRDAAGEAALDSAIVLRTAEIRAGRLAIGVGATLVRDSDPFSEVAETRAKARGLLRALGAQTWSAGDDRTGRGLSDHPAVRRALAARNRDLAEFWLDRPGTFEVPGLVGRRALIVDAEDTFTAMLAHQLRALGLDIDLCRFDEAYRPQDYDLVVMGPGPGDPGDLHHPKIMLLRAGLRRLLDTGTPFLAVCLSHQVLGILLGFDVVRRDRPNQGVQREIEFFGRRARLGFYNTFALRSEWDEVRCAELPEPVAVSRDRATEQVHGLAGPGFRSCQFHVESVLSTDGMTVLRELVTALLPDPVVVAPVSAVPSASLL